MRAPATITVLAIVGLLASGPAAARPACADAVITDWSDGRFDRVYPPACYAAALNALPEDVRNYSTAVDDIMAALRARIRAEAQSEATGSTAGGSDDSGGGTTAQPTQGGDDGAPPPGGAPALFVPELSGATGSLPLPLVFAAALALLLGLAGSTNVLARRLRHRRC